MNNFQAKNVNEKLLTSNIVFLVSFCLIKNFMGNFCQGSEKKFKKYFLDSKILFYAFNFPKLNLRYKSVFNNWWIPKFL